jgi:hypothetical protein
MHDAFMEDLAPLLAENADITGFAKTPDMICS